MEQQKSTAWVEVSFTLTREEARKVATRYFERYPKHGYDTHVAHWHVTENGEIFFMMRRYPTCD